jgi:hypothetical protein
MEVKILNYKFCFKTMKWREEFSIRFDPAKDRWRTILANALVEVSGLKISSVNDAMRVFEAIPSAIIYRIFIIYEGGLPDSRTFKTLGLYQAPEPNRFIQRIQEAEEQREKVMDRVEEAMAAKYGREELREAREQELEMLKNSKGRGLTRATPDNPPSKKSK